MLIGDGEVKIDIKTNELPSGVKEGSWLKLSFVLDPEGEQGQRKTISDKLDRLKNKRR